MVRIRLRRMGKKGEPSYRVVVADARMPRDGKYIEAIGYYNPLPNPSVIKIDRDRAIFWLERGAQPTDQVQNLLKITGTWDEFLERRKKSAGSRSEE